MGVIFKLLQGNDEISQVGLYADGVGGFMLGGVRTKENCRQQGYCRKLLTVLAIFMKEQYPNKGFHWQAGSSYANDIYRRFFGAKIDPSVFVITRDQIAKTAKLKWDDFQQIMATHEVECIAEKDIYLSEQINARYVEQAKKFSDYIAEFRGRLKTKRQDEVDSKTDLSPRFH